MVKLLCFSGMFSCVVKIDPITHFDVDNRHSLLFYVLTFKTDFNFPAYNCLVFF